MSIYKYFKSGESIDDKIEEWHNSDSNLKLHEYLGLTIEEYESLVIRPNSIKNDLMEISKRYTELEGELMHGGYTGEFADNHIISELSDEILSGIGELKQCDEVKKAMVNMFFLGQLKNR